MNCTNNRDCQCARCRAERLLDEIRFGDEFGRDIHPVTLDTLRSIAPLLLLMYDDHIMADYYIDRMGFYAAQALSKNVESRYDVRPRRKHKAKRAEPILIIEAHRTGANQTLEIVRVWSSTEEMISPVFVQDVSNALNSSGRPLSDFAYLVKVTDPAPDHLHIEAHWAAHGLKLSGKELEEICAWAPHFNEGDL